MDEIDQLKTMIQIIQTQRNLAYDQVVQIATQNAVLQKQVADLEKTLPKKKEKQ